MNESEGELRADFHISFLAWYKWRFYGYTVCYTHSGFGIYTKGMNSGWICSKRNYLQDTTVC